MKKAGQIAGEIKTQGRDKVNSSKKELDNFERVKIYGRQIVSHVSQSLLGSHENHLTMISLLLLYDDTISALFYVEHYQFYLLQIKTRHL